MRIILTLLGFLLLFSGLWLTYDAWVNSTHPWDEDYEPAPGYAYLIGGSAILVGVWMLVLLLVIA